MEVSSERGFHQHPLADIHMRLCREATSVPPLKYLATPREHPNQKLSTQYVKRKAND